MNLCCTRAMAKVCGITRQEDADAAIDGGAGLLGFIFHEPSPRNLKPEQAAAIHTQGVMRVGVFVRQSAEEVSTILDSAGLHLAQLAGDQDEDFCRAVGKGRVMRVLWPERYNTVEELNAEAARFAPLSKFLLLDAGTSGGGHGRTMNFSRLQGFRTGKSWFLAGGLGPENLDQALRQCSPCGVDINSGVESAPGVKDHAKMASALQILCKPRA